MTEYGPEIAVNGVRPKWLADDEDVLPKAGSWASFTMKPSMWSWSEITTIRIRADHWAYPVIAKGFEPWAGGYSAPHDWDKDAGRNTMWRDGLLRTYRNPFWHHCGDDSDIIGYRKRKAVDPYAHADGSRECRPIGPGGPLTYNPETHVLVERMTPAKFYDRCKEIAAGSPMVSCSFTMVARELFNSLGIIKPDPDPIAEYAAPKETHVLFERMTEEQWASLWHMNTPHALGHFFGIIKPAPDPIAEYATKHSLEETELRALLEAVKC